MPARLAVCCFYVGQLWHAQQGKIDSSANAHAPLSVQVCSAHTSTTLTVTLLIDKMICTAHVLYFRTSFENFQEIWVTRLHCNHTTLGACIRFCWGEVSTFETNHVVSINSLARSLIKISEVISFSRTWLAKNNCRLLYDSFSKFASLHIKGQASWAVSSSASQWWVLG